MNYIVLDLEWNQSNTGEEPEIKELPFEIIDMGAIKLNQQKVMIDEFNQLIKPSVYLHMHRITSKLIHLHMQDLQKGHPFKDVMQDFQTWCGSDYVFCTWGSMDVYELQRNMHYYNMEALSTKPIYYLDVQKLFAIAFEEKKIRRNLEYAIDFLEIDKDIPFHRAFSDAYYTAKILQRIPEEVLCNYSVDTYVLPANRKEEVHIQFQDYAKYISREFADKAEAMEDWEVISTKCYICHKNLRKKIRWFSPNGKHYYSVSICPVHGYMKSKIRIRKSENDGVYIMKTSKFITEEELADVAKKRDQAKQNHKMKNRVKTYKGN